MDPSQSSPSSPGAPSSAWLRVARSRIQSRIESYASSEIKFNLMGIVEDRRVALQRDRALGNIDEATADAELEMEREKREMWKMENDRRQHNYMPFVVELISSLAGKGLLRDLMAKGDETAKARRAAANDRKAGGL